MSLSTSSASRLTIQALAGLFSIEGLRLTVDDSTPFLNHYLGGKCL